MDDGLEKVVICNSVVVGDFSVVIVNFWVVIDGVSVTGSVLFVVGSVQLQAQLQTRFFMFFTSLNSEICYLSIKKF